MGKVEINEKYLYYLKWLMAGAVFLFMVFIMTCLAIAFDNVVTTVLAIFGGLYLAVRLLAPQQREYYRLYKLNYPRVEKFMDYIAPRRLSKKQKALVENLTSLKVNKIELNVIGHAERTLELRCGFALGSKKRIMLELLEKKAKEEDVYLCRLPNNKKCSVVIGWDITPNDVQFHAKTFFPPDQAAWFANCLAEDTVIKDDPSLSSLDRLDWHHKLTTRISSNQAKETN